MIKCYDLSKNFGKGENLCKAVSDINLIINEGEFVSIMGKSGSGKSTLLHLLGGIDKPTEGKIIIDEEDINQFNDKKLAQFRRENIGFIFQNFALINQYTVLENIMLALSFSKIPYKEKLKLINEQVKHVDIENLLDKKVYKLSGGEKQRVAITRAIINNPKIIFADEPTGSLDSDNSNRIMNILNDLNLVGKTIILVTHDIDIANKSKRIIKLQDGKITDDSIIVN